MSTKPLTLKQKMAKSVSGTSPSLLPPGIGDRPALDRDLEKILGEDAVVPSVDELIADGEDRQAIHHLVATHVKYNGEKKKLVKVIEVTTSRIKAIVAQYGFHKAVCDGASISYTPTKRTSINEMRLLAEGVSQETIDACKETTTSYMLKIGGE